MKIDAHVHFWGEKSSKKIWIREKISALQRPFTPEDLKPLIGLQANAITGITTAKNGKSFAVVAEFLS